MGSGDGEPRKLDDVDYEFVWAEAMVSLLLFLLYKLTDAWITRVIQCKTQWKYNVLCAKYMILNARERCKKPFIQKAVNSNLYNNQSA